MRFSRFIIGLTTSLTFTVQAANVDEYINHMSYVGRSYAESPGIDGCIFFTAERDVEPGDFVMVRITGTMDGDLTGEAVEELSEEE